MLKTFILTSLLIFTVRSIQSQRRDVFSTLQENAWYMHTTNPAIKLYVTEIGHGSLVVVLHGGPGNDFNYLIDALRPQLGDHRFILFDQRGSLLSPVPSDDVSSISLDTLVEDLERLRVTLGERQLTLFGHSFGTVVAQAYYMKYPQYVKKLVLAASSPPAEELAAVLKQARPRMKQLRERPLVKTVLASEHLEGDPNSLSEEQRFMSWKIRELASTDIVHLQLWRQVTGGGVYYNAEVDSAIGSSLPPAVDILPRLRTYPVPITIIDGTEDYLDPAGTGWKEAAKEYATITVKVLSAAGHYGWIDAPKEFAKYLREGLDRELPAIADHR